MLQVRSIVFGRIAPSRESNDVSLCRDPVCEGEDWLHTGWKFCDDDSERIRIIVGRFRRATFRVEGCRERFLKGGLAYERRWQPDARGARRFEDFGSRRDLERAPMVNCCVCCKNSPSFREC
jgi:hypothetical protein